MPLIQIQTNTLPENTVEKRGNLEKPQSYSQTQLFNPLLQIEKFKNYLKQAAFKSETNGIESIIKLIEAARENVKKTEQNIKMNQNQKSQFLEINKFLENILEIILTKANLHKIDIKDIFSKQGRISKEEKRFIKDQIEIPN